jgi:hypothetical protein
MPSKRKLTKPPAGDSGLTTDSTSGKEKADEAMNSGVSLAAAEELSPKDPYADGNAALQAFEDLFESSGDKTDHSPRSLPKGGEMAVEEEGLPRHHVEDLNDEEDDEDEDEIFLPSSLKEFVEALLCAPVDCCFLTAFDVLEAVFVGTIPSQNSY